METKGGVFGDGGVEGHVGALGAARLLRAGIAFKRIAGVVAACLVLGLGAHAQLGFTAPAPLNTNAGTDSGSDFRPTLATDGQGNWVAAWDSNDTLGGTIGGDFDILVARSADNGATWTVPAPLNTNAATDSGDDFQPALATDGQGNWVAAWDSQDTLGGTIGGDRDILVARSADNGATWTAPAPLNTNAGTDSGSDFVPTLATDGQGNWVAAWLSFDTLGGTIGGDADILVARSADNGATWTAPAPLNTNAGTDSGGDFHPTLATDGQGNWVAAWESFDTLGGTIGTDRDILVARSADNGATWTAPAPLNTNAATDSGLDVFPTLATDGQGNWVAAWESLDTLGGTIGVDADILVARSADNGATWTAPAPLNTNAATDSGDDAVPTLATDGQGNWVAAWLSFDTLGGTIGGDADILVARSADNGATWTAPAPLNTNAATDSGDDSVPTLATDGQGNWVAAWDSLDTLGGTIGGDRDILVAAAVPPVVLSVTRADADPTSAGTVRFDVTFSKSVLGVDVADFLPQTAGIVAAAVRGVSPATPFRHTVTVATGTGSGLLGLTVLDDGIRDSVGNKLGGLGNGEFVESEVYTIDKASPRVTMFSFSADPTPTSPIGVIVIFDEEVTGFTASDIVPGNASVQGLTGAGWVYSFNLVPAGPGVVTADIGAGVAFDEAGNGNRAALQFQRTYDPPTLTLTAPNGGERLRLDRNFTITWTTSGPVGPNVKLELLRRGALVLVITASTPNDGAQSWRVPSGLATGKGYAVRISSTADASVSDTSNATFAIK